MPWFPDLVSALELARRQTRAAGQADPVGQYFTALNRGDTHVLDLSVVFRTYCSQWPVDRRHDVRPPLLAGSDGLLAAAGVYDDVEPPVG